MLKAAQRFCDARGIRFVVVIFPQRFQVQAPDWRETVRIYGLKESCFDLGLPSRRIVEFCEGHGIACLDPTEQMR